MAFLVKIDDKNKKLPILKVVTYVQVGGVCDSVSNIIRVVIKIVMSEIYCLRLNRHLFYEYALIFKNGE